jgi:hypothetical protein
VLASLDVSPPASPLEGEPLGVDASEESPSLPELVDALPVEPTSPLPPPIESPLAAPEDVPPGPSFPAPDGVDADVEHPIAAARPTSPTKPLEFMSMSGILPAKDAANDFRKARIPRARGQCDAAPSSRRRSHRR